MEDGEAKEVAWKERNTALKHFMNKHSEEIHQWIFDEEEEEEEEED